MHSSKLIALAFCAVLLAEEPAKSPRPIPQDRQENISRAMLHLMEAEAFLREAESRAQAARRNYQTVLSALQKEFDAPGCELTTDKSWNCPKDQPPHK